MASLVGHSFSAKLQKAALALNGGSRYSGVVFRYCASPVHHQRSTDCSSGTIPTTTLSAAFHTSSCVTSDNSRKRSRTPRLAGPVEAEVKDKGAAPKVKLRSLTLRSSIAEHDLEVKLGQMVQWLVKGQSVSVTLTKINAVQAADFKTSSSNLLGRILSATRDNATSKVTTKSDSETVFVLTPKISEGDTTAPRATGTDNSSEEERQNFASKSVGRQGCAEGRNEWYDERTWTDKLAVKQNLAICSEAYSVWDLYEIFTFANSDE